MGRLIQFLRSVLGVDALEQAFKDHLRDLAEFRSELDVLATQVDDLSMRVEQLELNEDLEREVMRLEDRIENLEDAA
jgi:chromosome segregation ATPase